MATNHFTCGIRQVSIATLLLAVGWAAGKATPLPPGLPLGGRAIPSGPAVVKEAPAEESTEARLVEQGRDLSNRQESLRTAVKQTRLAYQILRQRGVEADSQQCRQLEARQRRLEQDLGDVEASLDGTRQRELRWRRCLRGEGDPEETLIPDDRWRGTSR
jgi:hypothetical protein